MNRFFFIRRGRPVFAAVFLFLVPFAAAARAQTAEPPPNPELQALVEKIGGKLRDGARSAETLQAELEAFAALRKKFVGKEAEGGAAIALMEAALYAEVLRDYPKAVELLRALQKDFPKSREAEAAGQAMAGIERAASAQLAKQGVIGKAAPALTFAWSTQAGLKTLADLRGKVVVIDFWATWCGPCLSSFPQVRELAAHYEGLDVVVLGVTSVQGFVANLRPGRIDTKDDPKREMELMREFITAKNITWPVVFSEQPVFNEEYGVSGIPHMAIVAPDGTVRHNGLHPAAPHAEKVAKIDALLKEFGKPTKS
jgi:thiol-disulfide isomerase/thioredoxin